MDSATSSLMSFWGQKGDPCVGKVASVLYEWAEALGQLPPVQLRQGTPLALASIL